MKHSFSPRRRKCRASLFSLPEMLESRIAPANVTVMVSGHTLKITGDTGSHDFTVAPTVGDDTAFQVSSASDTFNHSPSPYISPHGITGIVVTTQGADDSITFSPMHLTGGLSINAGNGADTVTLDSVQVDKNVTVLHGNVPTGDQADITLNEPQIGGNLLVKSGNGSGYIDVAGGSVSTSHISGNLTINTGNGYDEVTVTDTNIGKNVVGTHGHANSSGNAGLFDIYNSAKSSGVRSFIGGNVSISFVNGTDAAAGVWDQEVGGNVSINFGSADASAYFDGNSSELPVVIHGSLKITGSGTENLRLGSNNEFTGVTIGKSLTTVLGAESVVTARLVQVNGPTLLQMGNGGDTLTVDDSTFAGPVKIVTGSGADVINIDTGTGTSLPTQFDGAVSAFLGAGDDSVTLGDDTSGVQALTIFSTFVIHYGSGTSSLTTSDITFPFGGQVQGET